jgi:prepilin-type processing-associated H-X9-DG protein
MPILFTCPHCASETLVEDAYLGQTGPCATCGRLVTVEGSGVPRRTVIQSAQKVGLTIQNIGLLIGVIVASVLAGGAVIGIGYAVVRPQVQIARAKSLKGKSAEKLALIAQAMRMYHDEYGTFPPAYIADAKGKPMHSWRVLILPYLGEKALYQDYNFQQPWDSPSNLQLITRMPDVYASPGDDDAATNKNTSFLVVVGPDSIFQGTKSLSASQVKPDLKSTILVVESTESNISWMEPKDLSARTMGFTINGGKENCIRSHHPGGANVAFADEKVRFLSDNTPAEYVEAMTTATKQDDAPLDALPEDP